MKRIKLTQNKFTLVSDIDFNFISQWKWCAHKRSKTFYAVRITPRPNRKFIQMHSVILKRMGFTNSLRTDHEDGNGLNNQRRNLRPATHQQNIRNQALRKDNKSGFKGVYWNKQSYKWRALIKVNNKSIHLGYFTELLDAAKAYNRAAKKHHKQFAKLNLL